MRTLGNVLTLGIAAAMPGLSAAACGYTENHAIERTFAAAVERSGGVTVELRDAQSAAFHAWQLELDRLYRELMARMKRDEDRAALRKAQRAWLAFDEAETQWDWSAAMHGEEGTAGPLNVAGASLVRLQQRVCDLQGALEWLALSPGMSTGDE
jgi:uncharacterized protein YecT (DUF1311 family)